MAEVTEKVGLIKFDEAGYLKEGTAVYAQRKEVENVADELAKEGYSNIFLLGMGGTEFELEQFVYFIKRLSKASVYAANAADINIVHPNELTKDSLVITASASGDTVEIVKAAKWMKEEGIRVVAFTKHEGNLGKIASHVIERNAVTGQCEYSYLLEAFLIYRLLYHRGEFPNYDRFADQLKDTFKNLVGIRKCFEDKADDFAKQLYDKPLTIFTGSGPLWGETLLFSMCILEEMQWRRIRPVTSSQFFHGTLELVQSDVPVFIIKGEDEYRAEDQRVEDFCLKINAPHVVFDTKEFAFDGLDPEFRVLVSPWIATALLTERLAVHYEVYTKHNLQYRRYYRQFAY